MLFSWTNPCFPKLDWIWLQDAWEASPEASVRRLIKMSLNLLDFSGWAGHWGFARRLRAVLSSRWNFFGFLALISKDLGLKLLDRGGSWAFAHLYRYPRTREGQLGQDKRHSGLITTPLDSRFQPPRGKLSTWISAMRHFRSYLLIQSIKSDFLSSAASFNHHWPIDCD